MGAGEGLQLVRMIFNYKTRHVLRGRKGEGVKRFTLVCASGPLKASAHLVRQRQVENAQSVHKGGGRRKRQGGGGVMSPAAVLCDECCGSSCYKKWCDSTLQFTLSVTRCTQTDNLYLQSGGPLHRHAHRSVCVRENLQSELRHVLDVLLKVLEYDLNEENEATLAVRAVLGTASCCARVPRRSVPVGLPAAFPAPAS